MKKYLVIFIAIILTAAVFTGLSKGKTKAIKEGKVLSVNDIQADPSAYKGIITINGVVAGISPENPKIFAIIDTLEAKTCKVIGCAKFYLYVNYEGVAPKVWDEINVTGSLTDTGKTFIATKVEILRHLDFGGK